MEWELGGLFTCLAAVLIGLEGLFASLVAVPGMGLSTNSSAEPVQFWLLMQFLVVTDEPYIILYLPAYFDSGIVNVVYVGASQFKAVQSDGKQ